MDKRFFLALALSALVIVLTQMIFPQPKRAPLAPGAAVTDTVARQGGANRTDSAGALATSSATGAPLAAGGGQPADTTPGAVEAMPSAPARVIPVPTGKAIFGISTVGGAPVSAVLEDYRPLVKGGGMSAERVELARPGDPLLRYRLATAGDTIALDRASFTVTMRREFFGISPNSSAVSSGSSATRPQL